jgi:hypothetical protein
MNKKERNDEILGWVLITIISICIVMLVLYLN